MKAVYIADGKTIELIDRLRESLGLRSRTEVVRYALKKLEKEVFGEKTL